MNPEPPVVLGAATAFPKRCYSQTEIRTALASRWNADGSFRGDLRVLDRAGVRTRHLCFPLAYYFEDHGSGRRNDDWISQALTLGQVAVADALERAHVEPSRVGHFFFLTTTGLATPSLDALLAPRLGLPRRMLRTPVFGVGCAGGVVGMARAAEWLRYRPAEIALVLSVELCGQTFLSKDRSMRNLVGASLFGDGAAAVVLGGGKVGAGRPGLEILASRSELIPGTGSLMGWRFEDDGFRLVLSRDIPDVIRERIAPLVSKFLGEQGLMTEDVRHWLIHPGGPRVLFAFRSALELPGNALRWTNDVLERRGNLSSATVLVALSEFLDQVQGEHRDPVLLAAVGPGFAIEQVLGHLT